MTIHRFIPIVALGLAFTAGSAQGKTTKERPPAASTRDRNVMGHAADKRMLFAASEPSIDGRVPAKAVVSLSVEGLDPMVAAAIRREFVLSGNVDVVERSALQGETVVVAEAPVQSTSGGRGVASAQAQPRARVFPLTAENLAVDAPAEPSRWVAPDRLVQWSRFVIAQQATIDRWLLPGTESGKGVSCAELRVVDAATGIVRWTGDRCGGADDEGEEATRKDLVDSARSDGAFGSGTLRVLQLPAARVGADGAEAIGTSSDDYVLVNEALAAAGCQVVDVPPGAATAGDAETWSYDPSRFDLVGRTRLRGWVSARYAISVSANSEKIPWGELRAKMGQLDDQLVDPDLALLESDDIPVPAQRLHLKVVDLGSGRIVTATDLVAGIGMPGDILASALADAVLDRDATAWLEVRPVPATATVRVDRAAVDTSAGFAYVRLPPGKHGAELTLGTAKVEATAQFAMHGGEYGVLAMAAPYGEIDVTTTPAGVAVSVDGQSWGLSPVIRTTGGGKHTVVAESEGCGRAGKDVEVLVGDRVGALINLPGFLQVAVTPSDATILLNGQKMDTGGTGSAQISNVPYGANEVTYRLAGYDDHKVKVAVDSCRTAESTFTFNGTIRVASVPDRAEVRVDHEARIRAPGDIIVREGRHLVGCHWCEFGNAEQEVNVDPGRTTEVSLPLDASGFRWALGPYVSLLAVNNEPIGQVGAAVETWFGGRWGLQAAGALGSGGHALASLGPAVRALAPAPGWSMPLSVRGVVLTGPDGAPDFGAMGSLGFHACAGPQTSWVLEADAGYLATSHALVALRAGMLFHGKPKWKEKAQTEE